MAGKTKKQAKRLRRWTDHLSAIEQQLLSANLDRTIWEKVRDGVLNQHAEADAHFIASYSRSYVVGQVTRLRILAADRRDPRSIPDLLRSIRKNPEIVSREAWVEMVTEDPGIVGSDPAGFYDTHFGDEDGNLSIKGLRRDAKAVRKATAGLPDWTTQVAEHLDRRSVYRFRPRDLRLGYDELDEALDTLGEVTRRLQLLIKGSRFESWGLEVQADWQEPLRASLFPFEDVSFLLPPSGDFS